MVTLDNLNENILNKIDLINKNMEILIDKINIFTFLKNKEEHKIDRNFIKNTSILKTQYNIILEKINIYEISSVLFITEYYTNINEDNTICTNKKTQNIYNDNIFLLGDNNMNVLSNDYLLNLKEIYYSNFYQYKYYNLQSSNNKDILKSTLSKSTLKHLSKNIYNKFNIFLSTNDIYGSFDNFMEYLSISL